MKCYKIGVRLLVERNIVFKRVISSKMEIRCLVAFAVGIVEVMSQNVIELTGKLMKI